MPLPIPKFIKTAFANIGLRNNIPEITNNTTGAAGYDRGFGEINMLPEGAGGIPPDGKDFNGVFYELSSAIQYVQSGVTFPYNQDFADAIGGYDVGALVTASGIRYVSTISGNSVPPPSAGWQALSFSDPTEIVRGLPLVATQDETNAGTNDAKVVTPKKIRAGFDALFAVNGYITFPTWLGGLIIEWGQATVANNATVAFPLSFPVGPRFVTAIHGPGATNNVSTSIGTATQSNFVIKHSLTGAAGFYFFAIGT